MDLDALAVSVKAWLADRGVGFGEVPFVVDPIPRLITAAEWAGVEAGLAQRTLALNAFLRDVYGERRIVAAGIVSQQDGPGGRGLRARSAGPPARQLAAGPDHWL